MKISYADDMVVTVKTIRRLEDKIAKLSEGSIKAELTKRIRKIEELFHPIKSSLDRSWSSNKSGWIEGGSESWTKGR